MEKDGNMSDVIEEIRGATNDELKQVIEGWFEKTRTQGLKIGASYISAAIFGVIKKHVKKKSKPSLRDYQRMTDEIMSIISVQLTKQNDSNVSEEVEVSDNDGTAE